MHQEIFNCLCNYRLLSSSVSHILQDESLSLEEKSLLYETLIDVQNAANKIHKYCKNGA